MTNRWTSPCITAFLAGALLVGPLDFYHTWTGFQIYLAHTPFSVTSANWPLYIPLQMGSVGLGVLIGWTFFRIHVVKPFMRDGEEHAPPNPALAVFAMIMVAGGYFLSTALVESPMYTSWFVLIFVLSLIVVTFRYSKQHVLAFVMVGLIGIFAEWLLLNPAIGYYAFKRQDWFGLSSTWLLPVYGWVGIFVHQLSLKIEPPDGRIQ